MGVITALYGLVFIFGLCMGSFASAVIPRERAGQSWIRRPQSRKPARSECPSCHTPLKIIDLIPVLSWLLNRGQCRYCGAKIPAFYPKVELVCGVLCVFVLAVYGVQWLFLPVALSIPFLVSLYVIDRLDMILPNRLVFITCLLGLAYLSIQKPELNDIAIQILFALIVAALFWGVGQILSRWKKRKALGFGDVKFFAVAALWLGPAWLPVFMILSGVIGVVDAALLGRKKGGAFPFGPALITSFFICLLALPFWPEGIAF